MQLGSALRQIHRLFGEGTLAGMADAQLLERFAASRDEDAFAAIVAQHGPMVLTVCRRILKDQAAVEDAFQATFLILVDKARSIRSGDSLGGWLHRVAHRVAVETNREMARRLERERKAAVLRRADDSETSEDFRPALHEELARLPDKYRVPVVLCDLEGKTQLEAAAELRWSHATLRRRLVDAQERLRHRLTRRGLAPSAALVASALGVDAQAEVPAAWLASAVRSAVSHGVSASPLALAISSRVLKAALLARLKTVGAILALSSTFACVVVGVGSSADPGGEPKGLASPPAPRPKSKVEERPATKKAAQGPGAITLAGRVTDPAGRPVAGANILFVKKKGTTPNPVRCAISGDDGRFQFELKPEAVGNPSARDVEAIVATAPGFGFAFLDDGGGPNALNFKLVPDDVPVVGRILDIQGRPVAGARIRVLGIAVGDVSGYLTAIKSVQGSNQAHSILQRYLPPQRTEYESNGILVPPATTNDDGRFRLDGIGRDRLVFARIDGPGIESSKVQIVTRPGPTLRLETRFFYGEARRLSQDPSEDTILHGATFDHIAGPTRTVEGVVREASTGRGIAGVTVRVERQSFWDWGREWPFLTTTDAEGRFRLVGLSSSLNVLISARPAPDQPYLRWTRDIKIERGDGPQTLDFALKRGVWVQGRVIDKATRQPVPSRVEYHVFFDNPNVRDRPGMFYNADEYRTDESGRYRMIVFPGRGLMSADVGTGHYALGVGAERILDGKTDDGRSFLTSPHPLNFLHVNTIAEVNPAAGDDPVTCDLELEAGRTKSGKVVGPDDTPLADVLALGLDDSSNAKTVANDFTVENLVVGKRRRVYFRHSGPDLAGVVEVSGDDDRPIVAKLMPSATLVGRLLDDEGTPRAEATVVRFWDGPNWGGGNDPRLSNFSATDREGHFRIEGLVPGETYDVELREDRPGHIPFSHRLKGLLFKPGEVRDLGDVRTKTPRE